MEKLAKTPPEYVKTAPVGTITVTRVIRDTFPIIPDAHRSLGTMVDDMVNDMVGELTDINIHFNQSDD